MATPVALQNNYCVVDDVLAVIKLSTAPDGLLQQRLHAAINQASRLIDDYCNTLFYAQDFSVNWFDLRIKRGFIKLAESLFMPFPVSSITTIEEDDITLSSSLYDLEGFNTIYRIDSSGEPIDWGNKIRIKAKFGYNLPGGCVQAGYNTLPFAIRQQCAVFCAYLLGEWQVGQASETESDTLVKSGFENKTMSNVPVLGSGALTASPKSNPSNTYYFNQSAADYAVAMSLPVDYKETRTRTNKNGASFIGAIPVYEYKKLDSFRFLSVAAF